MHLPGLTMPTPSPVPRAPARPPLFEASQPSAKKRGGGHESGDWRALHRLSYRSFKAFAYLTIQGISAKPPTDHRRRMKVLFISHEARRSGAPMLLLSLLRWLKARGGITAEVLLLTDGPLRTEFAALGPTYVADELSGRDRFSRRALHRVLRREPEVWLERAFRKLVDRRYDCIYGNTILSLPWLLQFKRLAGSCCICHVHEMTWVIEQFFSPAYVSESLQKIDRTIACSASVAEDLQSRFAADHKRLVVANSFVDLNLQISTPREEVRRMLGFPPDAVLLGGVGKAELRKGVDLLVLLLQTLKRQAPSIDFRVVWVGSSFHDEAFTTCRNDLRKLELDACFVFVEHTPRPNDYIQAFDIFMMVSREDPMPLVALAAACLARPIVTFEKSGGITELVADGCGYCVPYLDIAALAETVVGIATDRVVAERHGQAARRKVESSYSLEAIAPKIYEVIQSMEIYPPTR